MAAVMLEGREAAAEGERVLLALAGQHLALCMGGRAMVAAVNGFDAFGGTMWVISTQVNTIH